MPGSERDSVVLWLEMAASNLNLARAGNKDGVRFEDLCFQCQQAAEKALKALHIHKDIPFRKIHDIEELLSSLEKSGESISNALQEAVVLTEHAVTTRYPGDYEPVSEDEYLKTLELAQFVYDWVQERINQ